MNTEYVLEFRHVTKVFPGVVALKDVTFGIRPGTVHVIMGENGAGKSTLMKIISGDHEMSGGQMLLNGEPVAFKCPDDAKKHNIVMIYQELQYVPMFTVEQFLMMGREPEGRIRGFLDWKKLKETARTILEDEGLSYDPVTKLSDLSVSDIQLLEITRAISSEARIIIMDEPTSALTQAETDRLFENIRKLKSRGITIIYISHKMDEIFRIGDYISVLRDGTHIETRAAGEYTIASLIRQMVGREVSDIYPKEEFPLGEKIFEVKNICTRYTAVKDVSFYVKQREIVGIAGLMGAGRTELVSALFGLDAIDSGEIWIDGRKVKIRTVADALRYGLMMVSEDRRKLGIVGKRSVRENMALANLNAYTRLGMLNQKKEQEDVAGMVKKLNVKTPDLTMAVGNLSGGNQQKVVLGKWLLSKPKILILDDPTRGIDVGSKHEIYKLMVEMARSGISIIMTSSELPELMGMCDRIYTMYGGHFNGELMRKEFSQEHIMTFISGGR